MKQDAHCMVILRDLPDKNVRGSLGWCHMMISRLSFVSGLNVCNGSETMGVGGIMGVFLCCFVFWEGRRRERVERF